MLSGETCDTSGSEDMIKAATTSVDAPGVFLNARTASRMCICRISGSTHLRTQYSPMNINATKGSVRKLAKTDHVANGARKKSKVEASAIAAKNKVQAIVT